MFGPWLEVFVWVKSLLPSGINIKRPRLNYITLHYMYLIGLSILSSIILYPIKNMPYIDALFFSSGAATQSGLNTIDVNKIALYQQITLMLVASIANPIFINTFVVFVRLFWFEKRFQNIVLEAQKFRRTGERSFSREETRAGADDDLAEKGIGDRNILVLRPDQHTMNVAAEKSPMNNFQPEECSSSGTSSGDNSNSSRDTAAGTKDVADGILSPPFRREITFADQVEPSLKMWEPGTMPAKMTPEQHIAFVENQRHPKDDEVLYIPGPRDFDKGDVPHGLEKEDRSDTGRRLTWKSNNIKRQISHESTDDVLTTPSSPVLGRRRGTLGRPSSSGHEGHNETNDTENPELRRRLFARTLTSILTSNTDGRNLMPYLSYQPTVGRNSAFVDLTEEQREELGGIEYRSLKTLALVLVSYYIGFHILGIVCFVAWIVTTGTYNSVLYGDAINKAWWGVFTSTSMFNDLGFTLTPDSMISFQYAIFPLLLGSFLIVIGNTGFPIMLRFIIWVLSKLVRRGSSLYEELRFLLDHPRRCFILLFPSRATWWLFWVLVVLNGLDVIFFIVLDLHDPIVTSLPGGIRVLDGWFQAASTRTAGFAVVDIADLHPGIQVSYLIMMYISVLPIAISVRRTNVYEERSLGIYGNEIDNDDPEETSYVGSHLRRQLSFDLWYIFLGLFIIAIVEGNRLEDPNDYYFSLFAVLFEIVSSYGTVGLSLGYPTINASFSAELSTISKLVIIAMQIRGRHRGLPYALDKAILLPSEGLQKKEDQDAAQRMLRRGSALSQMDTSGPSAGEATMTRNVSRRGSFADNAKKRKGSGFGHLLRQGLSAGPVHRKAKE